MEKVIKLIVFVSLLVLIMGCIFVVGIKYSTNNISGNLGGTSYRENTKEISILSATTTYSTSTMESVVYYRNLGITVIGESATGTLKFYCSLYDNLPTLYSEATSTNPYDTVQVIDTEDGSSIDGDTGITLANTTDVRQFEINSNNFRWCGAVLTGSEVDGTTTVRFKPADNQ